MNGLNNFYDDAFEKFMEEYQCPVELVPLTLAVRLSCSHHVNETALPLLVNAAKKNGVNLLCPICRVPVTDSQVDEKMRQRVKLMIDQYYEGQTHKNKDKLVQQVPNSPNGVVALKSHVALSKGENVNEIEKPSNGALSCSSDIHFTGKLSKTEELTHLQLISTTENSSLSCIDLSRDWRTVKMMLYFRDGVAPPEYIELMALEKKTDKGLSLAFEGFRRSAIVCEWILATETLPADCYKEMRSIVEH